MSANTPTTHQLKRALELSERIEKLQQELDSVLGGTSSPAAAPAKDAASSPADTVKRRGRRKGNLSPEARERIAAAQRARWAKTKGTAVAKPAPEKAAKPGKVGRPPKAGGKRVISPEARAKMAEAARRRWALVRKG